MPGRSTTEAIFIIRQLQEKYMAVLQKAFDRVPKKVIWWNMLKHRIEEWLVRFVETMYENGESMVKVGDGYNEKFDVGVH